MTDSTIARLCLGGLILACYLLPGCGADSTGRPRTSPHWETVLLSEASKAPYGTYFDMSFAGRQCGWVTSYEFVSGGGKLLHTRDGGTTWAEQGANGLWIDFVDEQVGWTARTEMEPERSLIGLTLDGGTTWAWSELASLEVRLISAVAREEAWVAGRIASGGEALLRTVDGGKTWYRVHYSGNAGTEFELTAMCFPDGMHGVLAGRNPLRVLVTADGGGTFAESVLPARPERIRSGSTHFSFVSAKEGWMSLGESYLLHTTDGGHSWEAQKLHVAGRPQELSISDCSFFTPTDGWATTWGGFAFRTSDGGRTWSRVETGAEGVTDCDLTRVVFTDDRHGWILGECGEHPADFPINRRGSRISFVLRYVP